MLQKVLNREEKNKQKEIQIKQEQLQIQKEIEIRRKQKEKEKESERLKVLAQAPYLNVVEKYINEIELITIYQNGEVEYSLTNDNNNALEIALENLIITSGLIKYPQILKDKIRKRRIQIINDTVDYNTVLAINDTLPKIDMDDSNAIINIHRFSKDYSMSILEFKKNIQKFVMYDTSLWNLDIASECLIRLALLDNIQIKNICDAIIINFENNKLIKDYPTLFSNLAKYPEEIYTKILSVSAREYRNDMRARDIAKYPDEIFNSKRIEKYKNAHADARTLLLEILNIIKEREEQK